VRKTFESAILFLIVSATPLSPIALAQSPRGPQLEVAPLAANSPPAGATVRASRMLEDRQMRELLLNGFPAALRFRLELWRVGGLFDDIENSTAWEMLVRYDPYSKQYLVVRRQGSGLEDFGGFPTLEAAQSVMERAFPVALRPRRGGARYYFNVVLDVETLSVSDLDELNRWLKGELQPAVRGKRAPLSALRRGIGTLLSRVLGGEKRHYEARSGAFRT